MLMVIDRLIMLLFGRNWYRLSRLVNLLVESYLCLLMMVCCVNGNVLLNDIRLSDRKLVNSLVRLMLWGGVLDGGGMGGEVDCMGFFIKW